MRTRGIPCLDLPVVGFCFIVSLMVGCSGAEQGHGGGNTSNESHPTQTETAETLGPLGGVVEVSDADSPVYGARVEIPPDALSEEEAITISHSEIPADLPSSVFIAGRCISFGPDGIIFDRPIDIFLPYSDEDDDGVIDRTAMSEQDVEVMFYEPATEQWKDVEVVSQDLAKNLVQIQASHFSSYVASRHVEADC